MAHLETEAVEITDVNSAAQAIAGYDEVFTDEENEIEVEASDEIAAESAEEEITEDEEVAPEKASENEPEETQSDEELEEVIQAPVSWSNEQKEVFAKLSPEAQEIIHLRDSQSNKYLQDKSTEIADQRKSYDADQKAIQQERQNYAQHLDSLMSESLPPKPNRELLNPQSEQYNPEHYHLMKAQHEDGQEYLQGLQAQRQHVAQQQQADNNKRFTEFVAEQDRELTETMPEWSNPDTKKDIVSYATKAGYEAEQLKGASALDIKLLHKAMKYDALMAKKPSVQDRVKTVPKMTKPGSKAGNSKFEAQQAKFNKLQKSGSVEDAAAVLFDLIE